MSSSFEIDDGNDDLSHKKKKKKVEEPSSLFQRFRVDQLLGDFVNKFPPKVLQVIIIQQDSNNF